MISVVIPVRNAVSVLAGQLDALSRQVVEEPWEVVVADNGSSDQTTALARSWEGRLPHLQIVDASRTRGVSHARNTGARRASGDRVLFCDADDEAAPGWVAAMGTALARDDAVGGCLDRRRHTSEERLRPDLDVSTHLVSWPGFLPFASGANCGVRREVFEALGGFDEEFADGGDDVDFFWRVQLAGHRLTFVEDAVIFYRERLRARDIARQSYGYGRQDPRLYRRFAAAGMPSSRLAAGARAWAHLLVNGPRYVRTPAGRSQWVRSAARRAGRLSGSLRSRVAYL